MPLHRAFYATAAEATAAATAAVDALNERWKAATKAAGADVESTAPVVAIRIESMEPLPALAAIGDTTVTTRIVAPDGRSELARLMMPTAQSDKTISAASGFLRLSAATGASAKGTVRARVAASVQVYLSASVTFATHVLQDRATGKKYQTGNTTVGPGVVTVNVTEVDAADLSDVTFGSALEFVSPPANVDPIARVNKMAAISVSGGTTLRDVLGRRYKVSALIAGATSGESLVGNYEVSGNIERLTTGDDPTDGQPDGPSLDVGAELTFETQPATVTKTLTVTEKLEVIVPKGTALTYTTTGKTYKTSADATLHDKRSVVLPFVADEIGSSSNVPPTSILTLTAPPAGANSSGTVTGSVDAAQPPQPYPSQIVGSDWTWTSRVYQTDDGRWAAQVHTLPEGS